MSASLLPLRKQTYSKTLIAIGIAVTALFVVTFLLVMVDTKQKEYDKAQQTAQSIVGTITADLARNIEVYDLSLQAVIDNLKHPGISNMDPAMRQDLLFDRSATAKYLGSIFVLDKTGNLLLDSRTTKIVPLNDLHKEYFQFHLNDASPGMHIGRPWTDVNGERFISISRRIPAPDGSFDGVVVGTLNLTYFIDLFNKVHLHEGDTLNLVQSDGRIVMRAPFNGDVIDADLSASTMFQRMTREGTGSFVSSWSHDGVERLFVFQQVGNAQLTMYYSLPLASIYSGWWVQTLRLFTIVAPVSVTNIMLIAFLARALKRSAKAEYHLALAALTDSLTGLFNRRHFDKVLDEEWRLAMRGQTPIGMLMIDADNFKAFNDGFGHQAGDTALIAIAGCIGAGARCEIDICARYCGEEFAVLLPGVAAKEAFGIAERIREGVMVLREKQDGRADKTPTVSIGVASMIPRPGLQAHDLIQKADVALYHAKANGRNRCELEDAPKTASWLPVIVGSELPLVAETNESRAPV